MPSERGSDFQGSFWQLRDWPDDNEPDLGPGQPGMLARAPSQAKPAKKRVHCIMTRKRERESVMDKKKSSASRGVITLDVVSMDVDVRS